MPFTGSHPAVVLPLMRVGLVPSALVIGSMAPDFPYYLGQTGGQWLTHTMLGVVTIDLLMGLLVFAAWQLAAPSLLALAPATVRERIPPSLPVGWREALVGWRTLAMVVTSLLLGGVTHVVWDAFTHPGRFGADHIPWLAAEHGPLPGVSWAQYASTIIGGLVVLAALLRWWRSAPPADVSEPSVVAPRTATAIWAVIICLAAGAGLAAFLATLARTDELGQAFFHGATRGGAAGVCALLGGLAAVQFSRRRAAA